MLNISNYGTTCNQHPISFSALKIKKCENTIRGSKLSLKSLRLMKALDFHIDRTWSDIKSGKVAMNEPIFTYDKGSSQITVKPIYNLKYPAAIFENHDGKICERVIFDREKPNNFRYEKTALTDYGSVTLKNYNSRTENNPKVDSIVDNLIIDTLPQIIPTKVLMEVFPKKNISKTNKGLIKIS